MTQFLTLQMSNRFSFTCPIMDTKVEMRGCVLLREKVYQGRSVNTRRGCQACIRSSKCPAAEIVRRIAFGTTDATDACSSVEEKHGRLPGDVLDKITPVLMRDSDLNGFNVTAEERALIASSRPRIEAQAATAPREKVESRRVTPARQQEAPRRASQKATQSVSDASTTQPTTLNQAAATGDLAAALNAA